MTFFAELGLLGITVGLFITGVLLLATLLFVHALYIEEWEDALAVILAFLLSVAVLIGAGFLFFATRFVKAVWAL